MPSKKVFIVEDEPELIDYYVEALELGGHQVLDFARNGAEAVEKFARLTTRPDVIIMDHRMPIKDGLQATREILRIDPAAKVIFASADASIETEARSLGAVSFKKKPFTLDRLIGNIDKA